MQLRVGENGNPSRARHCLPAMGQDAHWGVATFIGNPITEPTEPLDSSEVRWGIVPQLWTWALLALAWVVVMAYAVFVDAVISVDVVGRLAGQSVTFRGAVDRALHRLGVVFGGQLLATLHTGGRLPSDRCVSGDPRRGRLLAVERTS